MWYGVSVLFEAVKMPQPQEEDVVWEECVYLVKASSALEATEAGVRIGKQNEHEYEAAAGNQVRWTFRQIGEVYEIIDETVQNETEVFSRYLRPRQVKSLLAPFEEGPDIARPIGDGSRK